MDSRKMLAMAAIAIGGMIATTCLNMGEGRISGRWQGECHGSATLLEAKNGQVHLRYGSRSWDAKFVPGEENTARIGTGEIRFHVDGLTRNLELDLPNIEPCQLKKG